MSNLARIETIEHKTTNGKRTWLECAVVDDYGNGEFEIPSENGKPVDCGVSLEDDLSILKYCMDVGSDVDGDIAGILNSVLEHQSSIIINDTTYSWDEIKHLFGVE